MHGTPERAGSDHDAALHRAAANRSVASLARTLPVAVLIVVTFGVSVPAAGAAGARDGLAGVNDVAGVAAAPVKKAAATRWARAVRGHALTGVLRSEGTTPTIVVTRSVLAASPAAARRLARGFTARSAARWHRDDAAAAGIRTFGGSAAVWHDGALAGRVAVTGPPPASARLLARGAAAAITARLRAARSMTPWQRVTKLQSDRGPTTKQALQAFSLAFAKVPGVTRPSGGIDRPTDGTVALQWALARLGSMTAAQRKVVLRWSGWLHDGPHAGSARASNLESDWTADTALTAEAQAQANVLAQKLGVPLNVALHVGSSAHQPETKGAMAVTESATADGNASAGTPASCWITVYHDGAITSGTFRKEIFAHEVFHCYEAQLAGEIARLAERYTNGTTWMVEGGADWAACNAVPAPVPEPALTEWGKAPATPLMQRDYDGVGFFTLLSANGIDLWPRWAAIAKASSTLAAYDAAAGPEHETIKRVWASSLLQDPARGRAWDMDQTQPCAVDRRTAKTGTLIVGDGTKAAVSADAYAARLYELRSDADVIHTVVGDGDMRLSSDAPALDEPNLSDRYFCTDLQTDCTCPVSSKRSGPPPPRIAGDGGSIFAVTGGRDGVHATVEGMTREQYCGVKLGLIVPGRSIGDLYLGQSRKSVLRTVPGLLAIEHGTTTRNANGLLLRGSGLIGIVFQIHFGLCSNPALKAADVAACKAQFPKSAPDQAASIQTSSPGFQTRNGLGPGSEAAAVVAAYGEQYCTREEGSAPAEERPWTDCRVPDSGGGVTTWGFTADGKGSNTVLAVAVFNPKAMAD